MPYEKLDNMISLFNNLEKDVLLFKTSVLPAIDFPTDGIIIEVVNDYLKEYLGHTEHHHRWMIAVKDKGGTATTKVQNIMWQVGRTGNITPVLEIVPKQLSGATIHRVTAHNAGFVKKNYIGLGAEIEIIRSGEVIPKLIMVVKRADEVVLPSFCPACTCELVLENDFLKCPNMLCGDQIDRRIEYWFKTLDTADWFGIHTISYITKQGIHSIEGFYFEYH
jgi:DNA ligase (NAD+)